MVMPSPCLLARTLVACWALAGAGFAADRPSKAEAEWKYVAESAESGFDRPAMQKLSLIDELPDNVR
jgi:hypothetical protein